MSHTPRPVTGTRRLFFSLLSCAIVVGALSVAVLAQRGQSGPPEHAKIPPVNNLPNPYETVRNWGTLPAGRTWGSVSAINVDRDGRHIWAGDRCGANSCVKARSCSPPPIRR